MKEVFCLQEHVYDAKTEVVSGLRAGACGPSGTVGWPVFSPDSTGRKFAVYDLNERTGRLLKETPSVFDDWCMGERSDVVYMSVDKVIWKYAEGKPLQRIGKGQSPAWSQVGGLAYATPNRKRIVIAGHPGEKVRILKGPGTRIGTLAWAPDGEYIAFTRDVPGLRKGWWRGGVINARSGQIWGVVPNEAVNPSLKRSYYTKSLQWTSGIPDIPQEMLDAKEE